MKILWYVNIIMPKVAKKINTKLVTGGGWLSAQVDTIGSMPGISLCIVNITTAVKSVYSEEIDGVRYVLIPITDYIDKFSRETAMFNPDIVHIHGTEYSYNTDVINYVKSKSINYVVSVQGIMHKIAEHYTDGLPEHYSRVNPIIKLMGEIYYSDSIAVSKEKFTQQGAREIKALKEAKNVIGRTSWDKKSIININPNINYFHVNESLREEFYDSKCWEFSGCRRYSIFVSQGFYPIKGLHTLLKILPDLIRRYPDIMVYVGGLAAYTLNNKLLDVGVDYFFEYQAYIKKMIKDSNLDAHITFTGPLNAEQMKKRYLNSNIFLSCSTIENSPNSVAEAMLLAVPVVAADVGGTATLLQNDEGLLYKSLDYGDMFSKICQAFDNKEYITAMTEKARKHALITHDKQLNIDALINVYNTIFT